MKDQKLVNFADLSLKILIYLSNSLYNLGILFQQKFLHFYFNKFPSEYLVF